MRAKRKQITFDLDTNVVKKYLVRINFGNLIEKLEISNIHSLENHFEYDGTPGEFAKDKKRKRFQITRRRKSETKAEVSHVRIIRKGGTVMYRVALEFNMNLDKAELESICLQTDEIFANENISCEESNIGRRVYSSSEENQAFGRIWAAIFELKDTPSIAHNLTNGIWQNGEKKEDLISDFFNK